MSHYMGQSPPGRGGRVLQEWVGVSLDWSITSRGRKDEFLRGWVGRCLIRLVSQPQGWGKGPPGKWIDLTRLVNGPTVEGV